MTQPALTVAGLLASRPDAIGLPLELLSGGGGLARTITSPHIQKTGLALAGFHEYLHPERILVFGESEVRYLESLDAATRMRRWPLPSRTTSPASSSPAAGTHRPTCWPPPIGITCRCCAPR